MSTLDGVGTFKLVFEVHRLNLLARTSFLMFDCGQAGLLSQQSTSNDWMSQRNTTVIGDLLTQNYKSNWTIFIDKFWHRHFTFRTCFQCTETLRQSWRSSEGSQRRIFLEKVNRREEVGKPLSSFFIAWPPRLIESELRQVEQSGESGRRVNLMDEKFANLIKN